MKTDPTNPAGFTILELAISLAIFAVICGMFGILVSMAHDAEVAQALEEPKPTGLTIRKELPYSQNEIVEAFKKTHDIITKHGDMGGLDDDLKLSKKIEFQIDSGDYGLINVSGTRKVWTENDSTIVWFYGFGDGVEVFEYRVTITDKKIVYYLNVETEHASKLAVATRFRIETKKYYDRMMKELKN